MNGKKRRKKNNESQREVERKSTKRGEVREKKNATYILGGIMGRQMVQKL